MPVVERSRKGVIQLEERSKKATVLGVSSGGRDHRKREIGAHALAAFGAVRIAAQEAADHACDAESVQRIITRVRSVESLGSSVDDGHSYRLRRMVNTPLG